MTFMMLNEYGNNSSHQTLIEGKHSNNGFNESSLKSNLPYVRTCMILYSIGCLYGLPCIIAWYRAWSNRYTDTTAVRLYSLLFVGTFFRTLSFILVTFWLLWHHNMENESSYKTIQVLRQILGILGSGILVAVFLIIFSTWADVIEQVSLFYPRAYLTSAKSRKILIRMMLMAYCLQLIIILINTDTPVSKLPLTSVIYFGVLLILAIALFITALLLPIFGQHMCTLLSKVADGANRRQRNIRRISNIATAFCSLRALIAILAISHYSTDKKVGHMADSLNSGEILMDQDPLYFPQFAFSPSQSSWIKLTGLIQIMAYPIEYFLLMALLYVLPSQRGVVAVRDGYNSI